MNDMNRNLFLTDHVIHETIKNNFNPRIFAKKLIQSTIFPWMISMNGSDRKGKRAFAALNIYFVFIPLEIASKDMKFQLVNFFDAPHFHTSAQNVFCNNMTLVYVPMLRVSLIIIKSDKVEFRINQTWRYTQYFEQWI